MFGQLSAIAGSTYGLQNPARRDLWASTAKIKYPQKGQSKENIVISSSPLKINIEIIEKAKYVHYASRLNYSLHIKQGSTKP